MAYYVDDGGSATAPYDTWAKAATSLSQLDDAVTFASDDIVYIGHDHVCQFTHAASRTITGPTSGKPVVIISATQGSDPPTYQASTTDQVDTSEGAYAFTLSGSFALYGVRIKSGADINLNNNTQQVMYLVSCTLALGANSNVDRGSAATAGASLVNCTFDLTADGTTSRSSAVFSTTNTGTHVILGGSFVNPGYRTGSVAAPGAAGSFLIISGVDLSGFNNATDCELVGGNVPGLVSYLNCKTKSNVTYHATSSGYNAIHEFYNVGPADAPTAIVISSGYGLLVSSTAITRTGGASIESTATAWLITTTAACVEFAPFYTPWMYGVLSSTGSKTFDCYITNDGADLTDAEVWLEVQYMGTADDAKYTYASDQRASITASAAAQTDDTASTWTGTGPAFTYKQKLSVTATVNEDGVFRARVAVGKASIASSAYFYIDPEINVS